LLKVLIFCIKHNQTEYMVMQEFNVYPPHISIG